MYKYTCMYIICISICIYVQYMAKQQSQDPGPALAPSPCAGRQHYRACFSGKAISVIWEFPSYMGPWGLGFRVIWEFPKLGYLILGSLY